MPFITLTVSNAEFARQANRLAKRSDSIANAGEYSRAIEHLSGCASRNRVDRQFSTLTIVSELRMPFQNGGYFAINCQDPYKYLRERHHVLRRSHIWAGVH
jgi:hypothetical protein